MNYKNLFSSAIVVSISTILSVSPVYAGSADGAGPWADSVVSSSQANTKGGQPVSTVNPARSNPQAAVGPAEDDTQDDHFFSLGFGGTIVLKFDNGVRDGVILVEATNQGYPDEKAKIEVSQDNNTWVNAGTIGPDGQVSMPEGVSCVNYVKITDQSDPNDFIEDTADAYDVDGVKAVNAESCGDNNQQPTPTPTTGENPAPTPTQGSSNNSNNNNSNNNSQPQQCNAQKPGTPTITNIQRTSGSTVQLTWSAVSPVTTYSISYGTKSGSYQYGVPSTGNVTTYNIGGLDPNATYYFVVRAVNDCTPGDPSGEKSTGGGQVLGASTSVGEGQVLGASTDVLGATGSVRNLIALGVSMFSAAVSFVIYKKRTHAA